MTRVVGAESHLPEEMELSKKHEEIVEQRMVLLEQMEGEFERLKSKKRHLEASSRGAQGRNGELLKDVQKLQNRLRSRTFLHPDVVSLESRYWASVEEKIPEWELFLLGKGAPPTGTGHGAQSPSSRRQKGTRQAPPPVGTTGLPPRTSRRRVE
ncbi:hypothetical protein GN956_G5498 [Arapaima gigas]